MFHGGALCQGNTTDLNWPQIVCGSHDVLRKDRYPIHSALPFRRHIRRGGRWWGEEVTQKGGIRHEHRFQNGQERRSSIWSRNILQVDDVHESKGINKQMSYRPQHPLGTADDRPLLEERGLSL
jgi:hypothetical protein